VEKNDIFSCSNGHGNGNLMQLASFDKPQVALEMCVGGWLGACYVRPWM